MKNEEKQQNTFTLLGTFWFLSVVTALLTTGSIQFIFSLVLIGLSFGITSLWIYSSLILKKKKSNS